jgi:hypothetical protein
LENKEDPFTCLFSESLFFQFGIMKISMGFNYPCIVLAAVRLEFLRRILEVLGSNLGLKTGYPGGVLLLLLSFSSVPAGKRRGVLQVRPRPLPSTHLVKPLLADRFIIRRHIICVTENAVKYTN